MLYCSKCGKKINTEDKFCPSCGSKMVQKDNPEKQPDNKDKPKRSKIKSFFKWLSIITLILTLIGGAIIGTLFFIEESTRSGGGGGAISKAISRSYTEMGEQKCSRCKTSADCSWACEQYCGEQGYDGQEGSFGRDEKNLGGLLSTSYCSCRCYNEG